MQEPGNDFVDNQRFVVREGLLARIKGEGKNKKERKLNIILFNDMVRTHTIYIYIFLLLTYHDSTVLVWSTVSWC
ncbi:hypothetical protein GR268_47080 [Rhizobium leguminosarum]|nr:hypothetical protein [Rhizobium leguminosarum]